MKPAFTVVGENVVFCTHTHTHNFTLQPFPYKHKPETTDRITKTRGCTCTFQAQFAEDALPLQTMP